MQGKTTQVKPDYQAKLRAKAEEVYNQASGANESSASIEIIYNALKAASLESWKNGIEAGRRKANTPPKSA